MSRFWLIEITGTGSAGAVDLWLTHNGNAPTHPTAPGRPCKVNIAGANYLLSPNSGNTTVASDGMPFTEKPLTSGKGRPFTLEIAWCKTSVWNTLKDLIDKSTHDEITFIVIGTGEPGGFNVDAIGNGAPPYNWSGFTLDRIKGLQIQLITADVNS